MKRKTIVRLVDDDPTIRKSLSFLLKNEGFDVQCYGSAQEFLANDFPSDPGCLILDIKMPEISGTDLFFNLVSNQYPNPIIFLSAHGDIRLAVDMVKSGAMDFIEKPVDPEPFIELVNKACSISLTKRSPIDVEVREQLKSALMSLTEREKEVIKLIFQNLSNREIGLRLNLSKRTIEVHRSSIYKKLNIHSFEELKDLSPYFIDQSQHT